MPTERVRQGGVDLPAFEVQGYLASRPQPASELPALLVRLKPVAMSVA